MTARLYQHAGRTVYAMRFVGNGVEVAWFAGLSGRALGDGPDGQLSITDRAVACGDWVVRDARGMVSVVPQEYFAARYHEVDG
jgi:hypothetical protein